MSCWRSGRRRRGGACGSGVGCDDWTIVRILKIIWRHEGVAHTDYDTKVLSQKVLRLEPEVRVAAVVLDDLPMAVGEVIVDRHRVSLRDQHVHDVAADES